jgi:hypothetical protein
MADYRSPGFLGLQDLLSQGVKTGAEGYGEERSRQQERAMVGLKEKSKIREAQAESDIQSTAAQKALDYLLQHKKELPAGSGASMDRGGASITKPFNTTMIDQKAQHFHDTQVTKYSGALKPTSDYIGAAQDLERITNRDGKGGIFTNPNATLLSAGKTLSGLSDENLGRLEAASNTGIGKMILPNGMQVPVGASEERKAIKRLQQATGVSLGGARGMSPQIQQGIQQSTGQMLSGDPDLMAKGIRGSGRIVGSIVRTAQSGFAPEIRATAHDNTGMSDPMDFLGKISPENAPPSNYMSPPAGTGQPNVDPGQQRYQELLKKQQMGQ